LGSAAGEVTGIAPNGVNTDISFANGDPLQMNQTGAASGNILSIIGGGATTAPGYGRSLISSKSRSSVGTAAPPDASSQWTAPISVADNVIGLTITLRPV